MSEYTNIYRREYDNPLNAKGEKKKNDLIGSFRVVSVLIDDAYRQTFIGANSDDDVFLVTGIEVNGHNGGMRFEVLALADLEVKKQGFGSAKSDISIESIIAAIP